MLAACGKGKVVTLDIPGKPWTTPQLAEQLELENDGRDVCLLIGGPEGLSLNAKLRQNKAGHFLRSQCPIH